MKFTEPVNLSVEIGGHPETTVMIEAGPGTIDARKRRKCRMAPEALNDEVWDGDICIDGALDSHPFLSS